MSKKENTITMTAEDGEEIVFEVVEQTTIAGQNYLLVTDAKEEDEDGTAYHERNFGRKYRRYGDI